jgi:dolichyl-diphosphooligosaccharide--protein glycosyltransferase
MSREQEHPPMPLTLPRWNSTPARIAALLIAFMAVAFILRILPILSLNGAGFLYSYDTDGWYTLRQIEVMVNNFPQYNWFDPMTAYPAGKFVDWGPLYPCIAAGLCIVTGAGTQTSIAYVAGFVSPILAALMVPVVYFLGKTIRDWKAGIVAAGLAAVISYHYFFLSSYGIIGHHIAESFFAALFILLYLVACLRIKKTGIRNNDLPVLVVPLLLSAVAGVSFFFGLLSSPTVIIVLVVIAVFTLVQSLADFWTGKRSDAVFFVNAVFLLVSSALLTIFGFHADGMAITRYSPGLVLIQLAVIAESVVLFLLSRYCVSRKILFPVSIVLLGIIAGIACLVIPPLSSIAGQAAGLFFGPTEFSVGVVETLPLTLPVAWDFFGLSLILAAGGFLVLCYFLVMKPRMEWLFLLVWSLFMLVLTAKYQRFDYFSTVNLVLLSAICIVEPFRWQDNPVREKISGIGRRIFPENPGPEPGDASAPKTVIVPDAGEKKKRKSRNAENRDARTTWTLKTACLALVIVLACGLVAISVDKDIVLGFNVPDRILSPDWVESTVWLENSTPSPGVDYWGIYPVAGYTYPNSSYGVMASWDSGHWITFFGHRIPITNPFQDNLGGSSGAAAYFLSRNETDANRILSDLGGKYVIVDSDLAVNTFSNLIPWATGTTDISGYYTWFVLPESENPKILDRVYRFNNGYYQTIASRLYNFDGSETSPDNAEFIRYTIRQVPAAGEYSADVNGYARVISSDETVNIPAGTGNLALVPEGTTLSTGDYSEIYSSLPDEPVEMVPALKHYRLVYESQNNATIAPFPESKTQTIGVKTVKIFEYVPGAQIAGDGIIEVPLKTNTGRTFVYRQASGNKTFVVPYATTGSLTGVVATGSYHIVGTDRYFTVTENDVMQGSRVTALSAS